MTKELVKNDVAVLQNLKNMEFYPEPFRESDSLTEYTKLPISRICALGTAFEPLASAVQNFFGASATSGLYKVTIPSGTHLATFGSGAGNLGTFLGPNNQIAGQAVLNPLVCNPAMIFMAATLFIFDKKLDKIRELQQDILNFLVQKERAELCGNLNFLSDIWNNYRFNWNNNTYRINTHIKVLDIRQTAEQKICFYRDLVLSKLKKKSRIHSDRKSKVLINDIRTLFKDYLLALYTHGFSSFLDIMLVGNYDSEYLSGKKQNIEKYSQEFSELNTECYNKAISYLYYSAPSFLLRGAKKLNAVTGKAISKVQFLNKYSVFDNWIKAGGNKLKKLEIRRTERHLQISECLQELKDQQISCVKPFLENIEVVDHFHNNDINMIFDRDTVFLGVAEKA